jgi:hypothetical protein
MWLEVGFVIEKEAKKRALIKCSTSSVPHSQLLVRCAGDWSIFRSVPKQYR